MTRDEKICLIKELDPGLADYNFELAGALKLNRLLDKARQRIQHGGARVCFPHQLPQKMSRHYDGDKLTRAQKIILIKDFDYSLIAYDLGELSNFDLDKMLRAVTRRARDLALIISILQGDSERTVYHAEEGAHS